MTLTRDMLLNKHEATDMPDPDLDAGTCRRISGQCTALAETCRAAGEYAIGLHHDLKASEYLERARRIERSAARKEQVQSFLDVLKPL